MDRDLTATDLSYRKGPRTLIDKVSVSLQPGEVVALIGPNGAGKSTLLRLLTGYLNADDGECRMAGVPFNHYTPQALSRRRAVMLQQTQACFDWQVEGIIALGRAPWGNGRSQEIVEQVMALTDCTSLAGRCYATLSGSEQQRVQLARSLAQLWQQDGPQGWLFLDEPTSALDLYHQQRLLRLLRTLTRSGHLHVCVVLHDLNLAALWADRMLLLHQGRLVAQGAPDTVIVQSVIEKWYQADIQVQVHPNGETPHIFLAR